MIIFSKKCYLAVVFVKNTLKKTKQSDFPMKITNFAIPPKQSLENSIFVTCQDNNLCQ